MKKGILTTLLLASGAALAVYLLKEEQDKRTEIDEEKRMIKIRTDEEDKELVRTIQEIESLPIGHSESEIIHENIIERNFLSDFQLTPDFNGEIGNVEQENILKTGGIPSFIDSSMPLSGTDFEELLSGLPIDISTSGEDEEIQVEPFVASEEFDAEENVSAEDVNSADEAADIPSFIESSMPLSETDFEELLSGLPIDISTSGEDEEIQVEPLAAFSTELLEDSVEENASEFIDKTISDSTDDSLKYMFDRQFPNASSETLEELSVPSFESILSPVKLSDEVLKPIVDEGDGTYGVDTNDSNETSTSDFNDIELPTLSLPKLAEDDMSKTAVFDLPSSFKSGNVSLNNETLIKTPINPFDDDLEEIDLSGLFEKMDEEDAVDFSALFEDTSEIKLDDIDENEIKKLFLMDNQDDLEEIHLSDEIEEISVSEAKESKKELTEEEFEDFRKRLVHIGEDDIDLINFNDDKPFETTNHLSDEIDIINFGNIVEEPTIALEDLVLDKPIELLTQESSHEVENEILETEEPQVEEQEEIREYPNAIYDIHKLYPYLNLKFINAVFNNFDDFILEFKVGSNCKITHRVQFPDAQKLISFIEITKEYGYEIAGTDDEHNILLTLDFVNEESKILSEIYNISNQVNCLDGLYRGYELEHI